MYFGPGIKVKKPKEFWHGTLWRQSPLFAEDLITVRGKLTHGGLFCNITGVNMRYF
jgi:hypothetical protein